MGWFCPTDQHNACSPGYPKYRFFLLWKGLNEERGKKTQPQPYLIKCIKCPWEKLAHNDFLCRQLKQQIGAVIGFTGNIKRAQMAQVYVFTVELEQQLNPSSRV